MTNDSSSGAEMPRKAALFVGGTLFVLGWLCPLFVPVVAASNLPTAWKAVASGALLIGLPELLTVAAMWRTVRCPSGRGIFDRRVRPPRSRSRFHSAIKWTRVIFPGCMTKSSGLKYARCSR